MGVIIKIGRAIPPTARHEDNCFVIKSMSGLNTALQARTQVKSKLKMQATAMRNKEPTKFKHSGTSDSTHISYLAVNTMHLPTNDV
jgi:hypothetical protein